MTRKIEHKIEDTINVAVSMADNTMQSVKESLTSAKDKVVDVKEMLVESVGNFLGLGTSDEKKEEEPPN